MRIARWIAAGMTVSAAVASAADVTVSVPAGPDPGSRVISAINAALPGGCRVDVTGDGVTVRVDTAKLPHTAVEGSRAVRKFMAVVEPEATAAQAKLFGLRLPPNLDVAKPLVVLVHGLDMQAVDMTALADSLTAAGHQVATFGYPADQPIADDVTAFATALTDYRATRPAARVSVVGFSMGALVARGAIEGTDCGAMVDRMILIAPPNHGSDWAKLGVLSKCQEQIREARTDVDWSPSWAITSGLCEADGDLTPGSRFLNELNSRPRRDGVRYTIIAGDRSAVRRTTADAIKATESWVPGRLGRLRFVAAVERTIDRQASETADAASDGDGPVKLDSARLDGVSDFVVIHADHQRLIHGDGAAPSAATVVRDRLGR